MADQRPARRREAPEEEKKEGDYGIDVSLLPWLILSKDTQMIIPVDSVLTVVEPIDAVTQLYLDKMKAFI